MSPTGQNEGVEHLGLRQWVFWINPRVSIHISQKICTRNGLGNCNGDEGGDAIVLMQSKTLPSLTSLSVLGGSPADLMGSPRA